MAGGFVVPLVVLGRFQGMFGSEQNPVIAVVLGTGQAHRLACRQAVRVASWFRV